MTDSSALVGKSFGVILAEKRMFPKWLSFPSLSLLVTVVYQMMLFFSPTWTPSDNFSRHCKYSSVQHFFLTGPMPDTLSSECVSPYKSYTFLLGVFLSPPLMVLINDVGVILVAGKSLSYHKPVVKPTSLIFASQNKKIMSISCIKRSRIFYVRWTKVTIRNHLFFHT